MTQSSTVASLIRLSVTSGTRRADLGLPGGVPVAELLPELARELGVLDLDSASQGFRLVRHDGVPVDADRSLAAQGVEDGFVLHLEPAGEPLELKLYDDVVEAVSDLVESQFAPWTPEHSSRSALAAAVVFFLAGAFALFTARANGALVLGMSAAVALLLVVTATVLGQARRQPLPATALGLVAVLYAAVAGSAVTTEGTVWGGPLMYAGAGAVVVGAVGAALATQHRALLAGAAALGGTLGAIGAAMGPLGWAVGSVCAVTFAVAVIAGNLLPWFAMSWTRLSGNPPRTEAEIFADAPEVERAHVQRQVLGGHELMLVTGVVVGLLAIITAPRAAATGVAGTILGGVGFAAILLRTRHSRTRSAVLLSMVVGILGLATVALSAALYHPQWRPAVGVVLAGAAAVVVALALVAPRSRVRLGRLADTLDVMCLVALLPLSLAVVGLI
ncbi:MAG: type VII secretion integral membrane protein EccD [Pedococcus sp.]